MIGSRVINENILEILGIIERVLGITARTALTEIPIGSNGNAFIKASRIYPTVLSHDI